MIRGQEHSTSDYVNQPIDGRGRLSSGTSRQDFNTSSDGRVSESHGIRPNNGRRPAEHWTRCRSEARFVSWPHMDSSLTHIVDRIRSTYYAFSPASDADVSAALDRGVPDALLDFYRLADGALLGDGDDFPAPTGERYRLLVPRIAEVETTQQYGFVDDDAPYYGHSENWWQFIDYGDSNWLAFDATPDGDGRILDVFHETVGYDDEHDVVALNLPELFLQILDRGDVFWFDDDFQAHSRI